MTFILKTPRMWLEDKKPERATLNGFWSHHLLAQVKFTYEIIGIFFVYMRDFKKVIPNGLKTAVESEEKATLSL